MLKLFKDSPNDGAAGEIHPMAIDQLKLFEEAADRWGLAQSADQYYRCGQCQQAIWREVDDNGHSYLWSAEEIKSLIVAHIRQRHSEDVNGP